MTDLRVVTSRTEHAVPDGIEQAFRKAIPNHDDDYYRDLTERAVTIAMECGFAISSVVEAFVVGAENRGEGRSPH